MNGASLSHGSGAGGALSFGLQYSFRSSKIGVFFIVLDLY